MEKFSHTHTHTRMLPYSMNVDHEYFIISIFPEVTVVSSGMTDSALFTLQLDLIRKWRRSPAAIRHEQRLRVTDPCASAGLICATGYLIRVAIKSLNITSSPPESTLNAIKIHIKRHLHFINK